MYSSGWGVGGWIGGNTVLRTSGGSHKRMERNLNLFFALNSYFGCYASGDISTLSRPNKKYSAT